MERQAFGWLVLSVLLLLGGACGLLSESPDVHGDAARLRGDLNRIADGLAALAPIVEQACNRDPQPAACPRVTEAWGVVQRAVKAGHDVVDALESTGRGLELARDAVEHAEEAADAARAAIAGLVP